MPSPPTLPILAPATRSGAGRHETPDHLAQQVRAAEKTAATQKRKLDAQAVEIDRLRAELAAAGQSQALTVAVRGSETPDLSLHIASFEVHDHASMFANEPKVPCTGAGKPIKICLELRDAEGALAEPPRGFQVGAALHVDGASTPLLATDVAWTKRGGAPVRQLVGHERMLRLDVGHNNVFRMTGSAVELHAYIHVYSSEVYKRRLAIRFHAAGGTTRVAPALSIAVNNMSRTPNSRKSLTSQGVSTGRRPEKRPRAEPAPAPAPAPNPEFVTFDDIDAAIANFSVPTPPAPVAAPAAATAEPIEVLAVLND